MSENNSIFVIDKEILTMIDMDKFNSLYSVSRFKHRKQMPTGDNG